MTDHANRDVARRLWNAIAAADVDELRRVIAPHAVWRMHGRSPLAGDHVGIDAIFAFMAHTGELADELESDLLEIFSSEEGAILRYSVRTQRADRSLEIEHLFMIRVEDGQVVEGVFAPVDQERYDRFWLGLPGLRTDEANQHAQGASGKSNVRVLKAPATV
ncbi:MAG: nuclear transport factor 2 family protein [Deltaproteobacteria bacterium]|nr:nuclear transport factor 2 family protein [Deltaproteobacteria bacterium]MBW2418113.1 nuclear transport factor 2 family protein [Deltaproteobacteria bacterium]